VRSGEPEVELEIGKSILAIASELKARLTDQGEPRERRALQHEPERQTLRSLCNKAKTIRSLLWERLAYRKKIAETPFRETKVIRLTRLKL
jgi:hypothetical protein